jgi:hypothetical protein
MNHCRHLIEDIRKASRSEQVAEFLKSEREKVTNIQYGYGDFLNSGIILEENISKSPLQSIQKLLVNEIIWYRQVSFVGKYELLQEAQLDSYEKILLS